jgi:hypothetical protein
MLMLVDILFSDETLHCYEKKVLTIISSSMGYWFVDSMEQMY